MVPSIHDPLSMDLATATTGLLDFLDTQSNSIKSLERVLSSIQRQALEAFADVSKPLSRAETSQGLNLISHLLKNEHISIKVVELYRPLILDLVARWLAPGSASLSPLIDQESGHNSSIRSLPQDLEDMARVFALILPVVPQVKR